jgi:predicted ATPase
MFKQVTLQNYRTHKLTTIELSQITLLIGNNNAGKTNLLSGIQHFSQLVKRGMPNQDDHERTVEEKDFFPCRYILADKDEPVAFSIKWSNPEGEIFYEIALYEQVQFEQGVACRERITLQLANETESKVIASGDDKPTNLLALQEIIDSEQAALNDNQRKLAQSFFREFAFTFTYHLQPSFLKGLIASDDKIYRTDKDNVIVPSFLGYEGGNLQKLIWHFKENDESTFSKFIALMQRFESTFHGFRYDSTRSQLMWQFALKSQSVEEFPPEEVSDGLLKVAALSLLALLPKPPALVLLEEIENSINPGHIQSLMYRIWQASSPFKAVTQFILTSHSPTVLREFNEHLDYVYMMQHLDSRRFTSDVVNLNTYLNSIHRVGDSFDDDPIEEKGKRLLILDQYRLVELWHCGAIG